MAYIGRQPTIGNYVKCSDLTADGSTTTFNLTSSTTGLAVVPGSANNMIVSVSGVIQNPGTAYTVADSQITFTTAPGVSDTIDFVVILGDALAIGEPSDNTVTNAKIVDGTIQNAKLANNSITINGTSINLGASGTIVAGTDWQSVVVADGSTGLTTEAGKGYFINTTSGAITVTLPSSPTSGDAVVLKDYARNWASNAVTMASNTFDGVASQTPSFSQNGQSLTFVYIDGTRGWTLINDDTTQALAPQFITATGGTVTTSGDYKIHTFTGDGCFVVSCAGNSAGSDTVDYLVVAGGGGGTGNCNANSGGGGGAGGYRESHTTVVSGPYTASPLATPTGLTLTTQTYPITVGGGGTGGTNTKGTKGSNSVFSTIISAGGGNGGGPIPSGCSTGEPGGSGGGGGGGSSPGSTGGSGNTPATTPPQGNDGGRNLGSQAPDHQSGAGGGASAVGGNSNTPTGTAGAGGAGTSTAISGSSLSYAGGGGGTGYNHPCALIANGSPCGTGGRGTRGQSPNTGEAGTTNRGGGGGAAEGYNGAPNPGIGGAGGSGVVIIRYKYQ